MARWRSYWKSAAVVAFGTALCGTADPGEVREPAPKPREVVVDAGPRTYHIPRAARPTVDADRELAALRDRDPKQKVDPPVAGKQAAGDRNPNAGFPGFIGPGGGAPGPGGAPFPGRPPRPGERIAFPPNALQVRGPHPAKAAVMELVEDESAWLLRRFTAERETTPAGTWADDCFSGGSAVKVAGYQRYRELIDGWEFPIVEKPNLGEYRYVRFAWKRPEGAGVMVQFCVSNVDWVRYVAGTNTVGFHPAHTIAAGPPRDWEVVTRDLYQDVGGPWVLSGIAFTSMDGVALFDHVYLGRSIEDLDRVTESARSMARSKTTLGTAQLEQHFKNLDSWDAALRMPSLWAMAASSETTVPFLAERLKYPPSGSRTKRFDQAMIDLDSNRYAVRKQAERELDSMGESILDRLEAVMSKPMSNDKRDRLDRVIARIKADDQAFGTEEQPRLLWYIRVLEQCETPSARDLLTKLAQAELDQGMSVHAQSALDRMNKRLKTVSRR